jgi:hypothetical protein
LDRLLNLGLGVIMFGSGLMIGAIDGDTLRPVAAGVLLIGSTISAVALYRKRRAGQSSD